MHNGAPPDPGIRELADAALDADPRVDPYLRGMTREGPGAFVDNAPVAMRLLDAWGTLLPLVIVEPASNLTDVCSPIARFAGYPASEIAKRGARWMRPLARLALGGWAGVMRACRAERAVYVNSWMLATNPVRALSAQQYRELNAYLRQRFPGHAIVHRTVNPYLNPAHAEALRAAGARMVCNRVIYLIDPRAARYRRSTDVKRDRRHLRTSPYRMVEVTDPDAVDVSRLAYLYRSLYLDKHCALNGAFNARFFELVLRTPFFLTRLFERDGRIDALSVSYVNDGYITGALTGYDLSLPQSLGLYRMAIMHKLELAEERGMVLNISGGSGKFKCLRGGFPVREYDAVFDDHLPPWRRLPWRLAAIEGERWREYTAH